MGFIEYEDYDFVAGAQPVREFAARLLNLR
jgi:hypothetical protein